MAGQDEGGQTALHKAVRQTTPKPRLVKMLMQTPGVNVNALDFSDTTPVSAAALRGHDETVKILLQNPATDVHLGDDVGQTALNYADQALQDANRAIQNEEQPKLNRVKAKKAEKTIALLKSRGAIDFYA